MRANAIACTCPTCGAVFHRIPSRIPPGGAFCSHACANARKAVPIEQRIERSVDRSGDCHVWTGKVNPSGYPVLSVLVGDGWRPVQVSRLVLERKLGRPLRPGYCACHTCDNRRCCNAAHLWEGTRADNLHDMWRKGRGFRGPKPRSHTRTVARLGP